MANDFITPQLVARTVLATLYNQTVLLPLVWRDFDADFAGKQGATVNVRKPAVFEAQDFNRATGIVIQDADEDSVPITLDRLIDVSFAVGAEELTLEIDAFEERLLSPAMEAINQRVDSDIAEALLEAADESSQEVGPPTGGATASSVLTGEEGARAILGRNRLPTAGRSFVVGPEGAGVCLEDPLFVQADKSGSTDGLREASIGRVFGFDTYETQTFGDPDASGSPRSEYDGVAFQRQAVVYATRTLERPRGAAEGTVAVEEYRGIGIRTVIDYDLSKKQDVCSLDTLYGIDVLRPEAAVGVKLRA